MQRNAFRNSTHEKHDQDKKAEALIPAFATIIEETCGGSVCQD
jgi:hypothetical protein